MRTVPTSQCTAHRCEDPELAVVKAALQATEPQPCTPEDSFTCYGYVYDWVRVGCYCVDLELVCGL